jgi:fatty-acyl-CoA synthase
VSQGQGRGLIERIITRGALSPNRIALRFFDRSSREFEALSWQRTSEKIKRTAARLHAQGLRAGNRSIVVAPSPQDQTFAFLGAMSLQAVPTILSFPSLKQSESKFVELMRSVLEKNPASSVITCQTHHGDVVEWVRKTGHPETAVLVIANGELDSVPSQSSALSEPLFVQYSSGTTTARKGIEITGEMLHGQLDAYSRVLNLTDSDKIVSWLPLYHDMGLVACLLLPLFCGIESIHLSPFDWLEEPSILFEAITRLSATLLWLPNFAYGLCVKRITEVEIDRMDLSSVRAIINCSEPTRNYTHLQFLERFGRAGISERALQVCYGMAEGVFAISQTSLQDVVRARQIGLVKQLSCGRPLPDCEVRVGKGLEGELGEVEIRSPWMFKGYLGEDRRRSNAFTDDGWFQTGDLGIIVDGELYVTGRKKDMIIHRGINYDPLEIEEIIQQGVSGVRSGRVIVFGIDDDDEGTEAIITLAELEVGAEPGIAAEGIRRCVLERIGIALYDVVICEAQTLIKTTSGKLSRQQNRDKYQETLRKHGSATEGHLEAETIGTTNTVESIWKRILRVSNINTEASLFGELGADSLHMMAAVAEMRREFGIEVSPFDLLASPSIQEQSNMIGRVLERKIEKSILVTLNRAKDTGRTLYLVHGADGHPYNYLRLAGAMQEQVNVKAIVSPLHNPNAKFQGTNGLLEKYRDALLADNPHGPYILGGWSYGGLLAFDLARKLTEAGAAVQAIMMFDTDPPESTIQGHDFENSVRAFERSALDEGKLLDVRSRGQFERFLKKWHICSPTFRFIWGVRNYRVEEEILKLAKFVLYDEPEEIRKIVEWRGTSAELLDWLSVRIATIDRERFQQTFLPGLTGEMLHRAALIYKWNLIDMCRPREKWVFKGTIFYYAVKGNVKGRGWQERTSVQMRVLEYPVRPLAGKDAHTSMMDKPNVTLFARDLCSHFAGLTHQSSLVS